METAADSFMKTGVKSVKMDDLAVDLQMSKKTIYKLFKDKRELVSGCMKMSFDDHERVIREVQSRNLNVIDEMFEIGKFITGELRKMNPDIFQDLERFYPEAWRAFFKFKNEFVLNVIRENLKRGVNTNYYRSSLNVEITARLYAGMTDLIFDGENFPAGEYEKPTVYLELFSYHLHGIGTPAGIKYFEEKLINDTFK